MGASSSPSPASGMGDLAEIDRRSSALSTSLEPASDATARAPPRALNNREQAEEELMGASRHPFPAVGMGSLSNENCEYSSDEEEPEVKPNRYAFT